MPKRAAVAFHQQLRLSSHLPRRSFGDLHEGDTFDGSSRPLRFLFPSLRHLQKQMLVRRYLLQRMVMNAS